MIFPIGTKQFMPATGNHLLTQMHQFVCIKPCSFVLNVSNVYKCSHDDDDDDCCCHIYDYGHQTHTHTHLVISIFLFIYTMAQP